ncbi:MAG: 2TM domain-containing protein [Spirochaetales bacterium]|uniref:2TM domain-containing protein n=1 Tax=Candidatus Thalassospirochaeta sargassi TaxID=3119039 RepID=A0AAJ1IFT4_9SPIO|nr:2TM domain-containing protein [Spirochaetales bacterium]
MDEREEKYRIARKRAKAKIDFLRHLVTYLIVIAFLAVVNNITYNGYQWWLWPALGWGIGIVSHFLSVYTFKGSLFEERMIERELEAMDDREIRD